MNNTTHSKSLKVSNLVSNNQPVVGVQLLTPNDFLLCQKYETRLS
jgi:hypothetical protein